ncbi:MAG: hypothetical protein HKN19_19245 [Halioglobus sp.]|nr:hypothetical protein [Halioglobus sp.]
MQLPRMRNMLTGILRQGTRLCLVFALVHTGTAHARLVTWDISGQFFDHAIPGLAGERFHGKYVFNLEAADDGSSPVVTFHRDALISVDLFFGTDHLAARPGDEMLARVNNSYLPSSPPYDSMLIYVGEGDHASSGLYGDFHSASLSPEDRTMSFLNNTELAPAVLLGERWLEDCCVRFSVRFWTDNVAQGFWDALGNVDSIRVTVPTPASLILVGIGVILISLRRLRGQFAQLRSQR